MINVTTNKIKHINIFILDNMNYLIKQINYKNNKKMKSWSHGEIKK